MSSNNRMKMEKFIIFLKKNFKMNQDHCHYTGHYTGAAHSICNLKCSVPKEIPIAFYNGSNMDIILS